MLKVIYSKFLSRQKLQTELSEIRNVDDFRRRLSCCEEDIEILQRKNLELVAEILNMKKKQDATIHFYESRIDLIYRRLNRYFSGLAKPGQLNIVKEDEVDEALAKLMVEQNLLPPYFVHADISQILSDELLPSRPIRGPLSTYGFRLNRRIAKETEQYTVVGPRLYGQEGAVIYGPYKNLRPGGYKLTIQIEIESFLEKKNENSISADVYSPKLDETIAMKNIQLERRSTSYEIEMCFDWSLKAANGKIEIRFHQNSHCTFKITGLDLIKIK